MAFLCKAQRALRPHERLHSQLISCSVAGCALKFSSEASRNVHISRDHKGSKRCLEPAVEFECPVNTCKEYIKTRADYLKHMPNHLAEGYTFVCGYPECHHKSAAVNNFRVHMSTQHPKKRKVETSSTSRELFSAVCDDLDNPTSSPNGDTSSHAQLEEIDRETHQPEDSHKEERFLDQKVKNEYAKFYLRLESEFILPSTTVQVVAERIQRTTELSHHFLKRQLRVELEAAGLDEAGINAMISKVFKSDPIFNIHHKFKDFDQLGTHHLRMKYWKQHFPFVEPKQIFLGTNAQGKMKYSHYFPIKDSLTQLLKDPTIKEMVLQSFNIIPQDPKTFTSSKIFSDYTDGSEFAEHMKQHPNKKCLQLFLFQDGFDFAAFGPSLGTYKPLGFYYSLGNIKSEFRSKLGCIQMVYLCLEKYFKATLEEDIKEVDKLREVLKPLLDELVELKLNGMKIDGENIPVCLMFGLGDNAGQHFIGRYVMSFIASHCCRFCPTSLAEFKKNPTMCKPFRTPAEYDEAVKIAKEKWVREKEKALDFRRRKIERQMVIEDVTPGTKTKLEKPISNNAHKKLCGIHHEGVKYMACPLNSDVLNFHCSSPSLVVCIAHDLFVGIIKSTLPAILGHFSNEGWFTLELLNQRIKSFKCEGNDRTDSPTPLKSFESLGGNASENWTLFRNLPFIIEDLIVDKEEEMWSLYLQLKEIVELVTAPKISLQQVLYLKVLIKEYLLDMCKLLPDHLVPKQHYLLHYPDLILKFGPLIRLFTLRFESKHVFFKNVAKACKNFINITYTLSRKYACKFALDHCDGLLSPDNFNIQDSTRACDIEWSNDEMAAFHPRTEFEKIYVKECIEVHGILYKTHDLLQLGLLNIADLEVGSIQAVLIDVNSNVGYLLKLKTAYNSFNGYYRVHERQAKKYQVIAHEDLKDFYPIPVYKHNGRDCFTLKHSAPFVLE